MPANEPVNTNIPSDANLYKEPDHVPLPKSKRSVTTIALFGFLIISLVLIASSALYIVANNFSTDGTSNKKNPFIPLLNSTEKSDFQVGTFSSEDEFKSYLIDSTNSASNLGVFGGGIARMELSNVTAFDSADTFRAPVGTGSSQISPNRVSNTNVQVEGIDEPDIVKLSEGNIFFSF